MRAWSILLCLALSSCGKLQDGAELFDEYLLDNGYHYSFGLSIADVDGDGRLDIAASDHWVEGSPGAGDGAIIHLYLNDGEGAFSQSHLFDGLYEPKRFRGLLSQRLERNTLADINGDGRPDLLQVDLTSDRVLAFINPGPEGMRDEWPLTVLARMDKPVEIIAADFNGDGLPDMATGSWGEGGVWVSYNNGRGEGWESARIFRGDGWSDTRDLVAEDFDGDGRIDIITSDIIAGEVVLLRNTPNGWASKTLATDLPRPWLGSVADWNADGKPDHVFGAGEWIYALLNGEPWELVRLARADSDNERLTWYEVIARDINSDGRMDLVGSRLTQRDDVGGELVYFENTWRGLTPYLLKKDWGKANQVRVGDLNGDGKTDIIATTERPQNEVRYWIQR